MNKQCSYGIIPLRQRVADEWEVLLVQHHQGHWSFPKGHPEAGETSQQTAERELKEETGLTVSSYLSTESLQENYSFFWEKKRIYKTVYYFIALVEGDVSIQEIEINQSRWVLLNEASQLITFEQGKNLCKKTIEFLQLLSR